jgi:DNA-binding transcriptional LysR family regulator
MKPELRFILREGSTRVLLDALLVGELDCAIGPMRSLPVSELAKLRFWQLYPSDLCLVVNRSHPLARRKRVHIADLAQEPWALGTPSGQGRQTIEAAFVRAGLPPPVPVLECRPHFLNIHLVKQMPFVTVATRADAIEAEKAGTVRILPLDIRLDFGPVAFFCRKESEKDTLLMGFREAMMASANALPPGSRSASNLKRSS